MLPSFTLLSSCAAVRKHPEEHAWYDYKIAIINAYQVGLYLRIMKDESRIKSGWH